MFIAGGLGANPHPALALEEFTAREDLLPTIEAVLRVFDQAGNRDNKLRARLKWLVDTLGFEELQRRIFKVRHLLLASSTWPGGIPAEVEKMGDAPAGVAADVAATPMGQGTPVALRRTGAFERWEDANVVRGVAKGTVSAYAYAHLGDVTARPVPRPRLDPARARRRGAHHQPPELRVPRPLRAPAATRCTPASTPSAWPSPGAELVRDVVACPGADTCNLAVTQCRGLADAIADALEEEGLAEVGGVRINISGCTNSCGQHHIADIGFFGAERRAHGKSAPGYQMLLGGYVGEEKIEFGEKAMRLPAKNAPEAVVRIVRRFNDERTAGESFRGWIDRNGGAKAIGTTLKELDVFPKPDENPDFYVDYGETGPYVAEIGESECAT